LKITDTPSVSDDMRGRLLTDVYLQAYKQGWSKTFIYLMFNNSTGDNGYGLMDAPGRPTSLGRYIHNLTSILADNSSAFSPSQQNASTITINLGATYPVKVDDITQGPTPNPRPWPREVGSAAADGSCNDRRVKVKPPLKTR
jgi:hypothetical protein